MESWCGQPIVWTVCIGMGYLTLMVAALFVCTFCSLHYFYIIVFRNLRIVFRWKNTGFSPNFERFQKVWKHNWMKTDHILPCLVHNVSYRDFSFMFIEYFNVYCYNTGKYLFKQIFYFVKVSTINILSSIILLSDLVEFLVINKIIRCSWYFVHE